jgi:hypothetical protein
MMCSRCDFVSLSSNSISCPIGVGSSITTPITVTVRFHISWWIRHSFILYIDVRDIVWACKLDVYECMSG